MVRIKKHSQQLTDVELEMMNIIWAIGPCNVHEIVAMLPKERPLAYSSVSTIVRILEQKRFVGNQKHSRGFKYFALIPKSDYESMSVGHLVKNLFEGHPVHLVKNLLSTNKLSSEDIEQIKALIERGDQK